MSAGLMKPKYDTNNLPYMQHSPCIGIDHGFFSYFGVLCWLWNTADKSCMHCTSFRPVFIEPAVATELRSKCIKVDVNTFAAVQYNNRTLRVPYHYCYDLPYMCIWWEWVCFSSFFFVAKTVFVLYLRSSYISHNLLCSFPGIPTCQWCYVDTICLYKIDQINLYCLIFSVVVLFHCLSHLWMKKTATNQINNN